MARQLTITLDDDVAEKLDAEARSKGAPIDQVVNDRLRGHDAEAAQPRRPFRVRAFRMGEPLIDLECTASALEELDR
jgi:hypothetical protein